jgi:hypothetical protein
LQKAINRHCRITGNTRPKLHWTAKTVDYVEWVYALHGVLNTGTGKVTLKTPRSLTFEKELTVV